MKKVTEKSGRPLGIYLIILCLVLVIIALLVSLYAVSTNFMNKSNGNTSSSLTSSNTSTSSVSVSKEPMLEEVSIFLFNIQKMMNDEPNYFDIVKRTTSRSDKVVFALEEIIKGPSNSEMQRNLKPTFGANTLGEFSDTSDCGGSDFTLTTKGSVITVRFCRRVLLSGDMSGFVISSQINRTIKQIFPSSSVRLVDKNGSCFNDMKGDSPNDESGCILRD